MGIYPYQKRTALGVTTLYMVVAEATNKYTGKRVQKKRRGIPTKSKAQYVYRELWSMCREERPDGVNFKRWGELLDRYGDHIGNQVRSPKNLLGLSPQVIRGKQSRIKKLQIWRETHIELITPRYVTDQLDQMERDGDSRSITNHLLKEIKCVFSFAMQLGAIQNNPFAGLKMRKMPKKRKEALTHEEVAKLLSEARQRGHPYYHVWLLTITLGLRRSELAGLKWSDVNFNERLIYLRRQLIPREGIVETLKDREERIVAIPLNFIPTLQELKLVSKTEFVIEIIDHYWLSGQQAAVIRKFCKEIGIKEINHHQLRATHITLALVDGIPLGIVKENVGHAKLSTTDTYFRSAGIQMKGQTDKLRVEVPKAEEDGKE